jgi:hypothetical protein
MAELAMRTSYGACVSLDQNHMIGLGVGGAILEAAESELAFQLERDHRDANATSVRSALTEQLHVLSQSGGAVIDLTATPGISVSEDDVLDEIERSLQQVEDELAELDAQRP